MTVPKRKHMSHKTIHSGLLLLVLSYPAHAVENITVDANPAKFTRANNATGLMVSLVTEFANFNLPS